MNYKRTVKRKKRLEIFTEQERSSWLRKIIQKEDEAQPMGDKPSGSGIKKVMEKRCKKITNREDNECRNG